MVRFLVRKCLDSMHSIVLISLFLGSNLLGSNLLVSYEPKQHFRSAVPITTPEETVERLLALDSSLGKVKRSLQKVCHFLQKHKRPSKPVVISYPGEAAITIKYISALHRVVVFLPKSLFLIGVGHHKSVFKTLFVEDRSIYIAAYCYGDKTTKREVEVLQALDSTKGVVPFLGGYSTNKGENYSFFLQFCNGGDLRSYLRLPEPSGLSFGQKVVVLQEVVEGIIGLHKKGYIHHDIHSGNVFLIKKSQGAFQGVLADFGQTYMAKEGKSKPGYVAARRLPPEVVRHPIWALDRYKADIYAFGALLYEVAWKVFHPWGSILPSSYAHRLPKHERQMYYSAIVKAYQQDRKKRIMAPDMKKRTFGVSALTAEERFQILVFDTMHPLPKKRLTLLQIQKELVKIRALIF